MIAEKVPQFIEVPSKTTKNVPLHESEPNLYIHPNETWKYPKGS